MMKLAKRDNDILESVEHAAPMIRNMARSCEASCDVSYEDLYQIAAEVATRVYDRAQETSRPAAYIHRAIRNAILISVQTSLKGTRHRKQTLSDRYLITSLDAPLTHDSPFSLSNVVAVKDESETSEERDFERLYALLDSLPPHYREVISMYFGLCGYGVHQSIDIARILGVSASTVKYRLYRAKEMLREYTELLDLVESQTSD